MNSQYNPYQNKQFQDTKQFESLIKKHKPRESEPPMMSEPDLN
jgi:hypothetical protein